jgi:serine/threonine-protein kinase
VTNPTRHAALSAPNSKKLILELLEPMRELAVRTWEFDDRAMVRIGRSRDNDVALRDVCVSRHHLEIHFREGAWEFVSMGRYGTFVDGRVVDRVTLEDGAIVQLGTLGPRLRFSRQRPEPDQDARQVACENRRRLPFRRVEDRAKKPQDETSAPGY